MIIDYAKKMEMKFRVLLISFCAFAFLYSFAVQFLGKGENSLLADQKIQLDVHNGYVMAAMGILSLFIGYFFKSILLDYLKEYDWVPTNRVERISHELICALGIGVLYYAAQLGAMILFVPSFENVMVFGITLYHILFGTVAIIMYAFYRLMFIKF